MPAEILHVPTNEITFRFELRKQITCSLLLTNTTNEFVAFKVKTTAPKKYCVRPNSGMVQPRGSCEVTFTMQAQREAPSDYHSKDKFLIQCATVRKGNADSEVTQEMFNKEEGKEISETKLRVIYIAPDAPGPSTDGSEYEAKAALATIVEERDAAIKQSQRLQKDLKNLRGKTESKTPLQSEAKGASSSGSTVRSRAGFSLIYVFIIAVVGLLIGYIISQNLD